MGSKSWAAPGPAGAVFPEVFEGDLQLVRQRTHDQGLARDGMPDGEFRRVQREPGDQRFLLSRPL